MFIALVVAAAAEVAPDEIVITASRAPQEQSETAASATVIDPEVIERLGEPLVSSLVRLTPSAAVESGGPAGTLTQVRLRGAEANHTLLFIDGIRANDPAAGDIPRFELLNADIATRIEIVRGPQSALWGSDAIGGVVAVNGVPPTDPRQSAAVEAGSFGFLRASASGAAVSNDASVAGAIGWQRASGIDSFDDNGDRDGFRNLSGRIHAGWSISRTVEAGAAAFALVGRSEFDGLDPVSFVRADTLDETRNRLAAGRVWIAAGDPETGFNGTVSTSLLTSSNRNFVADEEINRTSGERWTAGAQGQYRFSTGKIAHTAILAVEHGREAFRARDTIYFGASNQNRKRTHDSITAEWRAEAGPLVTDIAARHDRFSAFADATTLRASALLKIGSGISLAAAYAEGIAQPTFFDLYGFFPGSFVGNSDLKPEHSRGIEASIRYRRGPIEAAITAYRQTLRDEIVDVFDPATFLSSTINRSSSSKRSGLEAEIAWVIGEQLQLGANYAYLDASEPSAVAAVQLREVRRPKHSGSVFLDGRSGRLTYGASLSCVGSRFDTDFDLFPAQRVRLGSYWLAGARLAYRLSPQLDLFVRGSNLLDERYQDVFGYRTEGRALFAGIRIGD